MALLDDIAAKIAQYSSNPYSTSGASSAVNSINSQYQGSALDQLNSLRNKYNTELTGYKNQLGQLDSTYQPIFDTLNQNATKAKTENQDVLNQNAVDENTMLRRITEQMANYGSLGSGQYPVLQMQAHAARQNNDTKIYNQRASDVANFLQQLSEQQAKKAAAANSINSLINSTNSNGESELATLLATLNAQRLAAVQNQQAQEQQAAAAAAAQQAQAAARAAASSSGSSRSSGGSSRSSGGATASEDTANVQRMLNSVGYNLSVDGIAGNHTKSAIADFQRAHGLSATGTINSATLSALESAMSTAAMQQARANQTLTTRNDANGQYIIANVGGAASPRKYSTT